MCFVSKREHEIRALVYRRDVRQGSPDTGNQWYREREEERERRE